MPTPTNLEALANQLLDRIRSIQRELAWTGPRPSSVYDPFAGLLDSMGLVEFLLQVAEDCGTTPEAIEECVGRRFTTVGELAAGLHAAGLVPWGRTLAPIPTAERTINTAPCWLGATTVCLPTRIQAAEEINAALHRPSGWLEDHAGIESRRLWEDQEALAGAAEAGRQCLEQAGLGGNDVGALVVTAEAPPLLTGLAAALHHRLGLGATTPALEVGGACTGFLAAWWLGRQLLPQLRVVVVVAVEAPSHFLQLEPGPAGEAAALFGDGAAACVLSANPAGNQAVPLIDVAMGADGSAAQLIQVQRFPGSVKLHLEGRALAGRAVRLMAHRGRLLLQQHNLTPAAVQAVIAHGGNGRLPALLARNLEVPGERVRSETPRLGNLGSASLPVAWAAHGPVAGPVLWTTVGAGLTWATALTGT